jgi:hypothetical protein
MQLKNTSGLASDSVIKLRPLGADMSLGTSPGLDLDKSWSAVHQSVSCAAYCSSSSPGVKKGQ